MLNRRFVSQLSSELTKYIMLYLNVICVVIAALASGADASYIFEEPIKIKDLTDDVDAMMKKMVHGGVTRGLILR